MEPHFYDRGAGKFMSSIHSWVIRTKHHLIVVDTCAGNDKSRPSFERFNMLRSSYLERLQSAGIRPEDVTHVLCTHLRSEEHTSELQSLMRISYAVFCLKKKNKTNKQTDDNN